MATMIMPTTVPLPTLPTIPEDAVAPNPAHNDDYDLSLIARLNRGLITVENVRERDPHNIKLRHFQALKLRALELHHKHGAASKQKSPACTFLHFKTRSGGLRRSKSAPEKLNMYGKSS